MEKYFLRWRGEVTGPFDLEEVISRLQDGKISKHHQVSTNRQTWEPISEANELRDACRPPGAGQGNGQSQVFYETTATKVQPEESSASGRQEDSSGLRVAYREPTTKPTAPAIWYAARGEGVDGPFTEQDLREQKARRLMDERTLLCRENEQAWIPMGELFPELFSTPMSSSPVTPGGVSEMISHAGFMSRFAAALIDGLILTVIDFFLMLIINAIDPNPINYRHPLSLRSDAWLPMALLYNIWNLILTWLYFTLSESSANQATLGKKALGLIVTDESGRRISFGRANGRYFGKIISGLLLCIGYLMAAFTDRKQALHDILAGTLVLKKVKFLAPIKELP